MTAATMAIVALLLLAANDDLKWVDEVAAQAHEALPTQKEYRAQIADSLRNARLQLKAATRRKDKQNIATLQKEVDRLESISKSKAPPNPEFPKFDGDIGRPLNRSVFVVQVISPDEAIIKILIPRGAFVEMWLHAPTAGWTDKGTVSFDLPVIVTGTKQYDTTAGSTRTIREARTWTKEEIDRFNNWRPAPKK